MEETETKLYQSEISRNEIVTKARGFYDKFLSSRSEIEDLKLLIDEGPIESNTEKNIKADLYNLFQNIQNELDFLKSEFFSIQHTLFPEDLTDNLNINSEPILESPEKHSQISFSHTNYFEIDNILADFDEKRINDLINNYDKEDVKLQHYLDQINRELRAITTKNLLISHELASSDYRIQEQQQEISKGQRRIDEFISEITRISFELTSKTAECKHLYQAFRAFIHSANAVIQKAIEEKEEHYKAVNKENARLLELKHKQLVQVLNNRNNKELKKAAALSLIQKNTCMAEIEQIDRVKSQEIEQLRHEIQKLIHDKDTTQNDYESQILNLKETVQQEKQKVIVHYQEVLSEHTKQYLVQKTQEIDNLKETYTSKINAIHEINFKSITNVKNKYKLKIDNLIQSHEKQINEMNDLVYKIRVKSSLKFQKYQQEIDDLKARLEEEFKIEKNNIIVEFENKLRSKQIHYEKIIKKLESKKNALSIDVPKQDSQNINIEPKKKILKHNFTTPKQSWRHRIVPGIETNPSFLQMKNELVQKNKQMEGMTKTVRRLKKHIKHLDKTMTLFPMSRSNCRSFDSMIPNSS